MRKTKTNDGHLKRLFTVGGDKKYEDNFDQIDWSKKGDKDGEKEATKDEGNGRSGTGPRRSDSGPRKGSKTDCSTSQDMDHEQEERS